jgi:hypothetical protein
VIRSATRGVSPLTMTRSNLASSIPLAIALSLAGLGCSTADGLGTSSSGGGSGPPPNDSEGDDGHMFEEPPAGLDSSGGDEPGEYECVAHQWRGIAYPIYAADELEVVSPGAGEPHSGICVGTEDVSEDGHWAWISVCGPRLDHYPADDPRVVAMLEAAQVKCEQQLFEEFESRWPELEQQYEHWLGPDEGTTIVTLSRVACVPLQADDPYADYAAGSCAGYDDPALAQIEPYYSEDSEDWVSCYEDPIGECVSPEVFGTGGVQSDDDAPAQMDICETYREHVAQDITVVTQGRHMTAKMDATMVKALLSLRFATCEYDRYDGTRFTEVDDWSIFAAIGLRAGDRPVAVQALASGQPTGPSYALGVPGQELEAFAGLLGVDGEQPEGIRVTLVRAGIKMTLDVLVVDL